MLKRIFRIHPARSGQRFRPGQAENRENDGEDLRGRSKRQPTCVREEGVRPTGWHFSITLMI